MTSEILVEAVGLTHTYTTGRVKTKVLHGIDLSIRSGSNVFLTGYSGSGKTTLISLIGCLRSVQSGSLQLLGQELKNARQAKLRKMRCRVGYVFQHFNLLDFMTIRQNVYQSLRLQTDYSPRAAQRRTEEMLDLVGLGDRFKAYPSELSGGEKQRVAIARALVHRPNLVLADEPTAALDTVTGREIMELFQQLVKQQNSAAIIVTHNLRILDRADEILHMIDGRLGVGAAEQLSLALPTLTDDQQEQIAAAAELRSYQPQEVIIHEGDEAHEFFILVRGELEVLRRLPDGGEGQVTCLSKRGTYFGEIALQEKRCRTATVRVMGTVPADVLVISHEAFEQMMAGSQLTRAVIKNEIFYRIMDYNEFAKKNES